MEHLFLSLLVLIMIAALASGFPVAFALPGSAIIAIGLAAARPIAIIAEPGNAKATGKPEANAAIIISTSRDKNRCSII